MKRVISTEEQRREYIERLMESPAGELRAMFACWAPTEIPDWFKRAEMSQKALDPAEELPTLEYRQEFWDYVCLKSPPKTEVVKKFVKRYEEVQARRQTEAVELERDRFFRWRWFFADEMLRRAAE